jgi:hypothetical protein
VRMYSSPSKLSCTCNAALRITTKGLRLFSGINVVKSGLDEDVKSFFVLWFNYRICVSGNGKIV